ncbi:hypothetical protein [Pantoea sp. CCBC3-3-1]|uniref:hypothetical protein n=1 Tax=Pantoea sp. CCBC3-3-1 TaxID=2490851 RepID=UPI0011BD7F18|nr:hypothetical protein [Pantoea sp. CCBC3-3-1]
MELDEFNGLQQKGNIATAQRCLAWLLTRTGITSPIVGNRTEKPCRTIWQRAVCYCPRLRASAVEK